VGELEGLQAIGETTLFRVKGREVSPSFARSSLVGTYRCEVIAGAGVERGRASEVVSSRAAWLAACCLAFLLATVGKGSSRGIRRGGGAACGVDSLARCSYRLTPLLSASATPLPDGHGRPLYQYCSEQALECRRQEQRREGQGRPVDRPVRSLLRVAHLARAPPLASEPSGEC
jgi:hypothetical protein